MSRHASPEAGLASLERLGEIGQDITASIDLAEIFAAVERRVGTFLNADVLSIGLLDASGAWLDVPLRSERGRRVPALRVSLNDPDRSSARCVREQCEIVIDQSEDEARQHGLPGALVVRSIIFRPLAVRGRSLGFMSIQSVGANAFGDREQMIFRILCAYTAIAVANAASAEAMATLRAAQVRLVEQEKHAALGRLVAGIAHEINTPVGSALTLSSAIEARATSLREALTSGPVTRAGLMHFIDQAAEGARQVRANLARADGLIDRFKQVAADSGAYPRQRFDLRGRIATALMPLAADIATSGHAVVNDVPDGLTADGYPGALDRVVSNLVANALTHAFGEGRPGRVRIDARRLDDQWLELIVADNGAGMPAAVCDRVFDPFFTTKRGTRHAGLGLHIAYNLMTQLIGGRIACESSPGAGTRFVLAVPITAPRAPGGMDSLA